MFTVGFYIWRGLNWSAAVLALLTLGERLYGRQVPVWLLVLLSVFSIIYSVGNGFGDKYNIHRFARLSAYPLPTNPLASAAWSIVTMS